MNFAEPLKQAEKITLKEMSANHPSPSVRMRAHAALLSAKGFEINELVEIFEKCRQTVSGWINSWRRSGLTGLFSISGGGRPKTLTEDEEKIAVETVGKYPRSIKAAVAELENRFKKKISISTLKRIAKRHGLSWKRIKKTLKAGRDSREFDRVKSILDSLIENEREGDIDLYYFDESGFSLDPYVPYAWQPEGKYIEVPAASKGKRINVLGFLSRKDSKFESFMFEGSVNSEVVISCFDAFSENINRKTYILVDNAPMHRSNAFIEKISEWRKKDMFIIFNCPYSPELNVIEILWRKIKYEWIPFSVYESYKKFEIGLCNILKNVGTEFFVNFASEKC
jgi:transposase